MLLLGICDGDKRVSRKFPQSPMEGGTKGLQVSFRGFQKPLKSDSTDFVDASVVMTGF